MGGLVEDAEIGEKSPGVGRNLTSTMLEFAVYDDRGPAGRYPLTNAHLVGPDDLVVPGEVHFNAARHTIQCQKRTSQAVGLELLADAGPMGKLMLPTCLLPDREEPYHLMVELARHRIKMFLAKSEDWQMFDLSSEHPAMQQWEMARQLFTLALTTADPIEAERNARKSLTFGIDATEKLAMAHAEILLHRRFAQRAASSATLGVRIWPGRDSKPLRDIVQSDFDVVQIPMRWRDLEVEEGKYNWDAVDRWVQWAQQAKKPVMGGPLLDFSHAAMPQWMHVWQNDYETCRDLSYDHIERVVQRYRGAVGLWNIAAGLNVNDNFRFTFEQMMDLARMATLVVRQARPGARTLVELVQPFGEYLAFNKDALPAPRFIERLLQEGIRMDAVGLQLLFGSGTIGHGSRDLMQMSNVIDRFAFLEQPILVTALGAPSESVDADGGHWHEAWSNDSQAQWLSRAFAILLSKPFVESVFWGDLYDHTDATLPAGGLITDAGKAKPALARLIAARRKLRKPLGPLKLPSKAPAAG